MILIRIGQPSGVEAGPFSPSNTVHGRIFLTIKVILTEVCYLFGKNLVSS